MNQTSRLALKGLFSYLKPHLGWWILSCLLSLMMVASNLAVPILLGRGIDCLLGQGTVDFSRLTQLLLQTFVMILLGALAQWGMNECNSRLACQVVASLRKDTFATLLRLPLAKLDQTPVGSFVSRVITDGEQLYEGLFLTFSQLFSGLLTILASLVLMMLMQPVCGVIVLVATPLSLFVANFIAKRTFSLFQSQAKEREEQTALVQEVLTNEKLVKLFAKEEEFQEKFREGNERLAQVSCRAIFFSSLVNPSTRGINNLIYALVALVGGMSVISGGMSVGTLVSFLAYATQYAKPFNEISGVFAELQNALACAGRMIDLAKMEREEETETNSSLSSPQGRVEISNLSFGYRPEQLVLKNLNLSVSSGEKIAILGPTGCGKTTLIHLLMRFYDPKEGEITIDGVPISSLKKSSLRSQIGMVLQDSWLKEGTVWENIKMGREASDQEVMEAAKKARAYSFLCRLPQGFDTLLKPDSLSQGERQLLCIARVMLKQPPILLLDEATSSIDTRTEQEVQKAFDEMMKGRTSFVVAHRLSTIREADKIVVMEDGKILQVGTHEELLGQEGLYRILYQSQFAEE